MGSPHSGHSRQHLFKKRATSILSGSAILPTEGGAPSCRDRKALMAVAVMSSRGRMMPTFSRWARACTTMQEMRLAKCSCTSLSWAGAAGLLHAPLSSIDSVTHTPQIGTGLCPLCKHVSADDAGQSQLLMTIFCCSAVVVRLT